MKTKQLIIKIVVFFLLSLLVFTFFSRTVKRSMLPRVRTVQPWSDSLKQSLYIYDFQFTELGTEQIAAYGNWFIEEVLVEEGDFVLEETVLFTINLENLESELLRLQSQARSSANAAANPELTPGDRRVLELESAAALRDYHNLLESFPSSGEILASFTGTIISLNVEPFSDVTVGTPLLEYAGNRSTDVMELRLSAEENNMYESVREVELHLKNEGRAEVLTQPVVSRKREGDAYVLYVKKPPELTEAYAVQYITLQKQSASYPYVLPNGSIMTDGALGDFVYVVDEALSGTQTIRRMPVIVLEAGITYSAVEIRESPNVNIVTYASKPIAPGDEVVVVYE